jgi:hypothetical protein
MTRHLALTLVLALTPAALGQPDPVVARILDGYEAARPTEKALAFFRMDWAPSLAEATARARKERRPVFFIYVTNITAGQNFVGGHC